MIGKRIGTGLIVPLLLTAGFPGLSAAQDSFRFVPCNGGYSAATGQGNMVAGAMSIPVGDAIRTQAELRMGQCGRAMTLTIQGTTVTLYQEAMDDRTWSGPIDMGDGVARDMRLTLDADRNLRGGLVATDGVSRVTRPVWLTLDTPVETRFEGCVDDAPPPPPDRGLRPEAAALANAMAERGMIPADNLSLLDYIETSVRGEESVRVRLRLSMDGAVLPRLDVALRKLDPESAYCLDERWIDPPVRYLDFQVHTVDGDPFVFARTIDIATSRIQAQAEGSPDTHTMDGLNTALSDAWTRLNPEIGPLTDGISRR